VPKVSAETIEPPADDRLHAMAPHISDELVERGPTVLRAADAVVDVLDTPFSSNHARSARSTWTENGTPSRSFKRLIPSMICGSIRNAVSSFGDNGFHATSAPSRSLQ
jgi:hypothetical protein